MKGADGFRNKDGKKLSPMVYGFTGAFKEIAEAVQGDLRKVGIDLRIQLFDATVAWGKLATQEFDAFGMSFPYVWPATRSTSTSARPTRRRPTA